MFKNQHTYNLDIKFRKGEGRTVKIDRQKDMWICVMLSRRQFWPCAYGYRAWGTGRLKWII